jgi:hypothetical protein
MARERSDEEILGRLIGRARLLVALSDEIPVETKLQVQPLLKVLEAQVTRQKRDRDPAQVQGTYALLYRDLEAYPDLRALLEAMEIFL